MKFLYLSIFFFIGITLIGLNSCNTDDFSVTAITVEAVESEIIAGGSFSFTVTGDNNKDITSDAIFKVDGNSITGNSFVSGYEPKTYTIQAIYNDVESEIIEVITVSPGDFVKNVLIEDYTGTWCGWCPRVAYAIHQAKESEIYGDKVIAVAIHMTEGVEDDIFSFDKTTEIREAFTIAGSGLPQGKINRITTWTAPEPDNLNEIYEKTGFSKIGLAINSITDAGTISGTININYLEDYTASNNNIVIYLIENGLIHDQYNYTVDLWSSGNDDPLVNFEHNDVLRAVYTNIYGVAIPSEEQTEANIYSYEFSGAIPSSVENNENLLLVAFVVNADTNEVLNVRESHLGETQGYQIGGE